MALIWRDSFFVGLVILALVQAYLLGTSVVVGGPEPISWVQTGDSLAGLVAVGGQGGELAVGKGRPMVLLVFNSNCGPCGTVAGAWASWMESTDTRLPVNAVSAESLEAVMTFGAAHGWTADVWSVAGGDPAGIDRAVTRRTPLCLCGKR